MATQAPAPRPAAPSLAPYLPTRVLFNKQPWEGLCPCVHACVSAYMDVRARVCACMRLSANVLKYVCIRTGEHAGRAGACLCPGVPEHVGACVHGIVSVRLCVFACLRPRACVCVHTCTGMHARIRVRARASVCARMRLWACTLACVCARGCARAWERARVRACVCICTCVCVGGSVPAYACASGVWCACAHACVHLCTSVCVCVGAGGATPHRRGTQGRR